MLRVRIKERPAWKELAQQLGFHFHTIEGAAYWDESAYYALPLSKVERDIEDPTAELHELCMGLINDIVTSEEKLQKLCIPECYWDYVRNSWLEGERHLYGRMDLAYDGTGPAKLYELNYDTPTSIYESAFFQWVWFEQQRAAGLIPRNADQYNSIEEKLIGAFAQMRLNPNSPAYFSCMKESSEDLGTVTYLRDCAEQAGLSTQHIFVDDIGISEDGQYTDLDDFVINTLFKLHPWEYMFREEFGNYLPNSTIRFIEPPWKSLLSNKGILPLLWEKHKGHPNLLPAFFDGEGDADVASGWVRKPIFSREGANIKLRKPSGELVIEDGPYTDAPFIIQAFHPLPNFEGNYPLVGSWVVGDVPCGIGIREDSSIITKNTSRFLPHILLDA